MRWKTFTPTTVRSLDPSTACGLRRSASSSVEGSWAPRWGSASGHSSRFLGRPLNIIQEPISMEMGCSATGRRSRTDRSRKGSTPLGAFDAAPPSGEIINPSQCRRGTGKIAIICARQDVHVGGKERRQGLIRSYGRFLHAECCKRDQSSETCLAGRQPSSPYSENVDRHRGGQGISGTGGDLHGEVRF